MKLGKNFLSQDMKMTWKHVNPNPTGTSAPDSDLQWSFYTCTFIPCNTLHFRTLADFYLKWHLLHDQQTTDLLLTLHTTHLIFLNTKTPPSTLPTTRCHWCLHLFLKNLETYEKFYILVMHAAHGPSHVHPNYNDPNHKLLIKIIGNTF